MDVDELARKYAVKNAHDYGSARADPIVGKLLSLSKGSGIEAIRRAAADAVSWANSLPKAELEIEYARHSAEFEAEARGMGERTAKPRLELDGAQPGAVVTRISPEPSGYMHIGHVKQALLSSEAARLYKGKLYRYFDDTNPEKCRQEYVDAMKRDHEWLGLEFDREYYASDFVDKIYGYAEHMLANRMAYVCECERETMQRLRFGGKPCPHRGRGRDDNMRLFSRMLNGEIEEGQAVVRFMGDPGSQNTTLRDPVLLRIVTKPHYRQGTKYRVWPMYDLNTPILDSINGITDIIRSKEYELRDELGRRILGALGLRVPRMHLEARLNIKGNETHKREIRKLIEEGKISGWDDPRLMTIMALRRRGIVPEAIKAFVMRFGFSKTDSIVPLDMLLAENRSMIDRFAKHLFFVEDPVKMVVKGMAQREVRLRLHPSHDYGFREYLTGDGFYISAGDARQLRRGGAVRLKDLADVKITGLGGTVSAEPAADGTKGGIIQWVSDGNLTKCSITIPGELLGSDGGLNPDGLRVVNGYVESAALSLREHEIVQFERFGYCILDSKKENSFIFTSK